MKELRTLLAVGLVVASVGCQSDKLSSRAGPPNPVASPQISYVFDDGFRRYFGSDGGVALARALREAHAGYQIQIDSTDSAK